MKTILIIAGIIILIKLIKIGYRNISNARKQEKDLYLKSYNHGNNNQ